MLRIVMEVVHVNNALRRNSILAILMDVGKQILRMIILTMVVEPADNRLNTVSLTEFYPRLLLPIFSQIAGDILSDKFII